MPWAGQILSLEAISIVCFFSERPRIVKLELRSDHAPAIRHSEQVVLIGSAPSSTLWRTIV